MTITAACESDVFPSVDVALLPAIPMTTKRRDAAVLDHGGEAGWRSYLTRLGVDAAILLCELRGREGGRHVYFVSLDEAKENSQLAEGLMAYAEASWQAHPTVSFQAYRIADTMGGERTIFGNIGVFAGLAVNRVLGGFEYGAVMHAVSGPDSMSALLLRRKTSGPFCELTQRRLLDMFPLVHEAAIAHSRSTRNEQRAALLEAMFDQVSLATLLISASGRPIFVNEAAREMFTSRRFILHSADGTLACADSAQTKLLRAAIQAATSTAGAAGEEVSIRIGQPEGDWRLAVVVPASTTVEGKQIRCAMVLIHKPQHSHAPSHMLKALGLLPSEQRFLESFLKTSSLSEAATRSGLSEETARTYLKRVRGKLGVHRQLELARLIYGLVPPIRGTQTLVEA